MTGNRTGESQIMHARAKRKRSRAAVVTGKTDDTLACLRGAVNRGAEKTKGTPNFLIRFFRFKILYLFGRLIAWPPACPCVYLRIKVFLRALQHFSFGLCCFQIYGLLMPCDGMLDGDLRVRAARAT
jgi:hypothetical protein